MTVINDRQERIRVEGSEPAFVKSRKRVVVVRVALSLYPAAHGGIAFLPPLLQAQKMGNSVWHSQAVWGLVGRGASFRHLRIINKFKSADSPGSWRNEKNSFV